MSGRSAGTAHLARFPDPICAAASLGTQSRALICISCFIARRRHSTGRPCITTCSLPSILALSPAEQEKLLRAKNDSVIKLNHVVHHGGIGHHVQNWHAYRANHVSARWLRLTAPRASPCSAAAPWPRAGPCYATDLMDETGFLTPLETYSEYQSRRPDLRQGSGGCAACITGRLRLTKRPCFYQERAGMSSGSRHERSRQEQHVPGRGRDLPDRQRPHPAPAARAGGRWVAPVSALARFHDHSLSYGSIPVSPDCAGIHGEGKHSTAK